MWAYSSYIICLFSFLPLISSVFSPYSSNSWHPLLYYCYTHTYIYMYMNINLQIQPVKFISCCSYVSVLRAACLGLDHPSEVIPGADRFSLSQKSVTAYSFSLQVGPCVISPMHIGMSVGIIIFKSCLGIHTVKISWVWLNHEAISRTKLLGIRRS